MKIKSAAFCKKLETELSERKRRTRRIESSRLQEVYSRNPEIKKLDDNLATIALDMGRQLMNAGKAPAGGCGSRSESPAPRGDSPA